MIADRPDMRILQATGRRLTAKRGVAPQHIAQGTARRRRVSWQGQRRHDNDALKSGDLSVNSDELRLCNAF